MATLNAIGGTVAIDMTNATTVNHTEQAAPTHSWEYSWKTSSGLLIHAFSFDDDITFDASSPLSGTVHALQAVSSYTVGGLAGDLVAMTASPNQETYWRTILSGETTIFASGATSFLGAGDFVEIGAGETVTGAADRFVGEAPPAGVFISQHFAGDARTVAGTATLTGGNDEIHVGTTGVIAGDADTVSGVLIGGADTIVLDGTAVADVLVTGDARLVDDLGLAVTASVVGGDDTIVIERPSDALVSGDIGQATAALGTSFGGDDLIDASANSLSATLIGDVWSLGDHTVRAGDDTLVGSSSSGSILAGDAGNVFDGQLFAGADTLSGGNAADSLYGDFHSQSGGTVTINATFTGDDVLRGGGGNDQLFGQVGDDTLDGGMGDDVLDGGTQTAGVGDIAAFNTLTVAVSVDLVGGFAFGQGVDSLVGCESIRGSNLSDSLGGSATRNQIEGLDGNDHMFGRSGDDTMIGGNGKDVIRGGADDDTITGGADADTITGNGGNDRFDYNAISESGTSSATRDIIRDFVQGGGGADLLDLNTIDAQASVAGNQNFTFIGAAAFSAEGQIRFSNSGGHTFIEVNTSGVSGVDMSIALVGVFAMTGADFVL